jgi:hypothetical protein
LPADAPPDPDAAGAALAVPDAADPDPPEPDPPDPESLDADPSPEEAYSCAGAAALTLPFVRLSVA